MGWKASCIPADIRGQTSEFCAEAYGETLAVEVMARFFGCHLDLLGAKPSYEQGGSIPLSGKRRQQIDWQNDNGEEPPGA